MKQLPTAGAPSLFLRPCPGDVRANLPKELGNIIDACAAISEAHANFIGERVPFPYARVWKRDVHDHFSEERGNIIDAFAAISAARAHIICERVTFPYARVWKAGVHGHFREERGNILGARGNSRRGKGGKGVRVLFRCAAFSIRQCVVAGKVL